MSQIVHKTENNKNLKILVGVVSTSRTDKTDISGETLMNAFLQDGHNVNRIVCKDDEVQIINAFESNQDYDIFIFVGGTGPSRKDVTVQSLRKIAEKEMVGFGEMFRLESRNRLAYLSNATLFVKNRKQIYCIPGSPDATAIAHTLIDSVMGHLYHELNKE
ncbi:MAG: molybdopterin-binding protein [Thermoplasmatales archaeon]